MAQEIEIEYKVLLSKEKYDELESKLPFPNHSITQINYYFETNNFQLKKHKSALRIREKNNKFTLTLKQPHENGILETHDPLSKDEFLSWINNKPIPKPSIGQQLQKLTINEYDLHYYGSLKTERKIFEQDDVLYMLDKSFYNGIIDYELEIEANSREVGYHAFRNLLEKFNIKVKRPITKIERFFNSL
ncbi:CYTH domain-containing protein [Pseudogracilibacillus sp. SE30717A]|uniref:CYTH domain-containing protein n=1 Tax=Pseudogracilibacillus sp. SE30717A TaxID=3098293 RepID=UPI00300DF486